MIKSVIEGELDGSPAHAGIDPTYKEALEALNRFPRTRGDRPRRKIVTTRTRVVPPHTRG